MLNVAQQAPVESVEQVTALLFYLFAVLTCLSGWAVVFSQNIVRMSVYLLLTLGGAAGLYFLLNAEFLAAIQLVVYAGGTLILIVFGVMLTSKSPFAQLRVQMWEMMLGVLVGGAISGLLLFAWVRSEGPSAVAGNTGGAGYDQVSAIGRALLGPHLVAFEVAAVLLLVVMIGAAYLARRTVQR